MKQKNAKKVDFKRIFIDFETIQNKNEEKTRLLIKLLEINLLKKKVEWRLKHKS